MNRFFASFLFLLILLIKSIWSTSYTCDRTSTCGCSLVSSTTITARIVGGEIATDYTWSWILSLQLNNEHECAASLLSDEYAITAAHCFPDEYNPEAYSILAGTNVLNDQTSTTIQRRVIQEIHRHPNFDRTTFAYDITILRFASLSIDSNSTLSVICLPTYGEDPFEANTNLVTVGWGVTSFLNDMYSNVLRQVTVQVFSPTSIECQTVQETNVIQHFCAGVIQGGKGIHRVELIREEGVL